MGNKTSINFRIRELVQEMINLNIRYTDARDEFEKIFITEILSDNGHNLSEAAGRLGLHRNTLNYKLKELKLKPKSK